MEGIAGVVASGVMPLAVVVMGEYRPFPALGTLGGFLLRRLFQGPSSNESSEFEAIRRNIQRMRPRRAAPANE